MEVRIEKRNLDDWFNDRMDYFNSDNQMLSLPGLQNFAYYLDTNPDEATYLCVPSHNSIRKREIQLPLDIMVRLQEVNILGAEDVLFRFRKSNIRIILPDYFDRRIKGNMDLMTPRRYSGIICEDTENSKKKYGSLYVKGNPDVAQGLGIIIV